MRLLSGLDATIFRPENGHTTRRLAPSRRLKKRRVFQNEMRM